MSSTLCYADDIDVGWDTHGRSEIKDTVQAAAKATTEPKINSRAAVVMDRNTKTVLYGRNETSKRAMASTTKIMTALVVLQNTNLKNTVTISKKAAGTGGSRLKLKTGDKISVHDLLYGLLLRSGNDAAVALAEYVGGSVEEFATLMNQNADALGLDNTHFVTPHGLDSEDHYTTAYELALLADQALHNPVFAEIVKTKSTTIHINGKSRAINNTNELLGNLNGVYGVKTGFTNGANRCLVTSVKRGDLDVICVVLGADTKKDRTKDSVKLIEYVFKTYENYSMTQKIKEYFSDWYQINQHRIHIEKGVSRDLALRLSLDDTDISYPIKKGTQADIGITIEFTPTLQAPIPENTVIGKLVVTYQGHPVKEMNIVNTKAIKRKQIPHYFRDFFKNYHNYLKIILTK